MEVIKNAPDEVNLDAIKLSIDNKAQQGGKNLFDAATVFMPAKAATNVGKVGQMAKGTTNLKYFDYIGYGRAVNGHTGYLGSPRLTRSELLQYRSDRQDIGIRFERNADRYIDNIRPGALGGFDYSSGTVYLRRGTTRYEAFHEFTHAKQFSTIGQEAYINLGTYSRESHVFNEIYKNRTLFTKKELKHSIEYIRDLKDRYNKGKIN